MDEYGVGYTTGVFDLFHVGHLNILKRAKEQCDYLIVGVMTDELVWKCKHKKPTIPFADRAAIVGAIRYVDRVVAEETLDKKAAWERLRFDAFFHGDDRKGSVRYNQYATLFEKLGVKLVFFPYTAGISSTMLSELLAGRLLESEPRSE